MRKVLDLGTLCSENRTARQAGSSSPFGHLSQRDLVFFYQHVDKIGMKRDEEPKPVQDENKAMIDTAKAYRLSGS